jgi:hypothetical protein
VPVPSEKVIPKAVWFIRYGNNCALLVLVRTGGESYIPNISVKIPHFCGGRRIWNVEWYSSSTNKWWQCLNSFTSSPTTAKS